MIPQQHVDDVCRPGQKDVTCAYLTFGVGGMQCAKELPGVRVVIEQRLADGTMGAKGDNCEGWFEL